LSIIHRQNLVLNNEDALAICTEAQDCMCGLRSQDVFKRYEHFQLVALVCYFLSFKFWERFPPKVSKLVEITDCEVSEKELLDKEQEILMFLEFDLKVPLVTQFVEFHFFHEPESIFDRAIKISYYLTNLTLTEVKFRNHLASTLSAVIVTLSKMILNAFTGCDPDENYKIYDATLFHIEDFRPLLEELWMVFGKSLTDKDNFKFQKKKFSSKRYGYLLPYMQCTDFENLAMHYSRLCEHVNNVIHSNISIILPNYSPLSPVYSLYPDIQRQQKLE